MKQSALSTVYVQIQVSHTVTGVAVNPTTDAVAMAFVPPGTPPVSGDWTTGSWDSDGTTHKAQVLVGPGTGGLVLAVGTYTVWVRVTDNPEIPIVVAGTLTIL